MREKQLVSDICTFVADKNPSDHAYPCEVSELVVLHDTAPTRLEAQLYQPVVCLVLQGAKETWVGERRVRFGAGQSLIVSHNIPVVAGITQASKAEPYVAMVLALDLAMARSLRDEIETTNPSNPEAYSLVAGPADDGLIDAMGRLFALRHDPLEARVLAPLIMREIHFRLLMADHGGMLRALLHRDSHADRVARAIRQIQDNFTDTLVVRDLAGLARMSLSTFHEHFKAVTGTSPLQYQKDIRLIEARRLLLGDDRSVSSIAFDVGYESPTQFSREYARKFGMSPRAERQQAVAA